VTTPREQASLDLRTVFVMATETLCRSDDEQDALRRIARALDSLVEKGAVEPLAMFDGQRLSYESWAEQTREEEDEHDADVLLFSPSSRLVISPLLCDTTRGTAQQILDERAKHDAQ